MRVFHALCVLPAFLPISLAAQTQPGYYRMPSIRGETIVFVAEGDLWKIGLGGGTATRLTSHPSRETSPVISPDGRTVAFAAKYEGPTEVYTMPITGGLPVRRTWFGDVATPVGWTPDGRILVATAHFATLPNLQLRIVDPATGLNHPVPLSQAADGVYDSAGRTLFFTRQAFQGSHTRHYQGGTAEQLWKYVEGQEASGLTVDYAGTSRRPMWWRGRVYFASDRDGTMNLWSMNENGGDLRQHTSHKGWDVRSPSLGDGRIVYQLGADLHLYDIAANHDTTLAISLPSDFDQLRERWIKSPMDYLTAAHLSPNGDRVVLTARGQIFVAPAEQGRLVDASRRPGVRYRDARFFADGKSLLALTTETGEVELARLPANGVGPSTVLTTDGKVLRWEAVPSPDGKWIAHYDKDQQLWLYEVATRKNNRIAVDSIADFAELRWSPDSHWLVYGETSANLFQQLFLYDLRTSHATPVTSDRYQSWSPTWSPDGKWLYFLSNRHFASVVSSPWGERQPEPYFDRMTEVYAVGLRKGLRFPFQPADELVPDTTRRDSTRADSSKATQHRPRTPAPAPADSVKNIAIDLDGLAGRLFRVPLPAGNLSDLSTDGARLYYVEWTTFAEPKGKLSSLAIGPKPEDPTTLVEDINDYELSLDRKKILIRKGNDLYVVAAGPKVNELEKAKLDLSGWTFSLVPHEEYRQMFSEAWRLERDYFYDPAMHGNNWPVILTKYQPLVDRVTDREELADLLSQMVSELSALHIFVYGGDRRDGADDIAPASLGATLERDSAAGGYRISHIYRADPDEPENRAPLAALDWVTEGDVIESIDGVSLLSAGDPGAVLRNQAGKQVLIRIRPAQGTGAARDAIVVPMKPQEAWNLRYNEWEFTRRERVDQESGGRIGYVHLRAMGGGDMANWARDYYPVFNRDGLIIDVRHNRGGNIDSWVLEKLLRRAWFYWQGRIGKPVWNMQYAFRGHVVVLCDEWTASDGEAFSEGFRRLGIGKVIGTRTWGGEIWLSSNNFLVDKGIATAAESGVYGPEGVWLIEGHGVDPDIVVDNLPHASFEGQDAQLEAAISYLQDEIRTHPVPVPPAPAYPRKAQ
jgi:tricorn protease